MLKSQLDFDLSFEWHHCDDFNRANTWSVIVIAGNYLGEFNRPSKHTLFMSISCNNYNISVPLLPTSTSWLHYTHSCSRNDIWFFQKGGYIRNCALDLLTSTPLLRDVSFSEKLFPSAAPNTSVLSLSSYWSVGCLSGFFYAAIVFYL